MCYFENNSTTDVQCRARMEEEITRRLEASQLKFKFKPTPFTPRNNVHILQTNSGGHLVNAADLPALQIGTSTDCTTVQAASGLTQPTGHCEATVLTEQSTLFPIPDVDHFMQVCVFA